MKRSNIIIGILALCLLIAGIWLFQPANCYICQALIYQRPKIDQYRIFENRIVHAGEPHPWPFSTYYNRYRIPEQYLNDFDKLGTIAYLIIQNGELLFEQYWNNYSPQSYSNSFSMAKSIVSLAVGCAIDDGFMSDLDQPVSDYFPQFKGFNGKTLTVRHLLTMSAGLDFQEAYSSIFSSTTEIYYGNDLNKFILGMKSIAEPGVNFIYQSGVTQLLASIVEKATGENISSYVSRKIWTPIQAEEDALWSLDRRDGMEKAFCCFNTNARDFARLGQLILNEGIWNGRQIVSAKYIREATTPDESLIDKECHRQECQDMNRQYGFQFWILEKDGMKIPYLRGLLGQYIFVIPDKNAVVVRLGHAKMKAYTDGQNYPADIDIWLNAAMDILDATPRQVRLMFAGDLMQNLPQVRAARNNTESRYDYSESFQFIKQLFQQADLTVVNLETTITPTGNFSGYPLFRSPSDLAACMSETGIDVAVMANNHVFDGGKQGVITTTSMLDSIGIQRTGVFIDSEDFLNHHPLYIRINGIQFALLNYTYGTNGLPTPEGLYINRIDSFAIIRDIQQIDRSTTDAIIAYFHWGQEYSRQPDAYQKAIAALCHRYGVEIVIGSHPHVVQPISYYEEDDGAIRYVTFYSLGNLVSNQRWRYSDGGIIAAIDVQKEKGYPISLKPWYAPVWVQLPKYRILTLSAADTIPMTLTDRKAYNLFISDVNQLLRPDNNHPSFNH